MMDRRTALLALGVLAGRVDAAQRHLHAVESRPQSYKLQFFSAGEEQVIDRVAEMIIPADEHSPGAHAAQVSYYIDLVAANSSETAKANWKSRLAAFNAVDGKPFLELKPDEQAALLNRVSANERRPETPAEHFFTDMKRATLFGYYTSQIGLLNELEYKGNAVLANFPGCPHGPDAHR